METLQNKNELKFGLYSRKSSEGDDRQILSIESQIDELKDIAKKKDINIVEVYKEAKSAKAPGRPIFNQMMKDVENGKINAILCWKIDRLSRNPKDDGTIKWLLQKEIIKRIETFGKVFLPGDNVLLLSVEQGVSNQFVIDLSINTKRGLRKKVATGWLPGRAPLGYYNNKYRDKGEKDILPDRNNFSIVKRCWQEILEKRISIHALYYKAVNEWGLRARNGKKPAKSRFYDIFSNPFYYGKFRYNGEIHNGNHIPMISEEDFEEAQYIIGNKKKPHPKRHIFSYTGLIRCGECGGIITAESKIKKQKNGNIHHYTYYRCTKNKNLPCSQKCLPIKDIEKQIDRELKKIKITPEFHSWAMSILKRENRKEAKEVNEELLTYRRAYDSCVQRITSLIDMRASNELTSDEFLERKQSLIIEKNRLEKFINLNGIKTDTWLEKAEKFFDFAEKAHEEFTNGSLEKKRQIFTNLGENFILKDNILQLNLSAPLLSVLTINKELEKEQNSLEPVKTITNKDYYEEIYTRNPVLGAYWDLNPD